MSKLPKTLLVDDEEVVLETLSLALEAEGLELDTARTAEEALAMVRTGDYGLIVADKNLPGMSGIELIREIRTLRPKMRALLITGYASIDSAMEGLHLGVEGFIEKPFDDIFAVAARVKTALSRPATDERAARVASGHFNRAMEVLQAAKQTNIEPGSGDSSAVDLSLQILVVNSDPAEREWLAGRLGGDPVEAVASLDRSDSLLRGGRYDLVILDADFDEASFFEQIDRVRTEHPQTVCVVTATKPSLSGVIRLIDLGVRAVVEKPLQPRGFDSKIGPVLAAAREGKRDLIRRAARDDKASSG